GVVTGGGGGERCPPPPPVRAGAGGVFPRGKGPPAPGRVGVLAGPAPVVRRRPGPRRGGRGGRGAHVPARGGRPAVRGGVLPAGAALRLPAPEGAAGGPGLRRGRGRVPEAGAGVPRPVRSVRQGGGAKADGGRPLPRE